MSKTAVIFSPKYYRHNPGVRHPETAKRLGVIINELKRGRLSKSRNWQFVEPRKALMEEIELVHDRSYIKMVETVCNSGGGPLDSGDTVASPETFEVAFDAVGGVLKAVDLVMEKKFENAFALVRPPGHHAAKFSALGFCVFNNVAIAAEFLLKRFKLNRVLILDIDAHHGNGTQETFYETDKVLYISLHEDPRSFPGTGFVEEVGTGKGLGCTVNVPLPFQTSDQIYLKAIREIVTPIVRQYKPQFMLVSAGLDGHYTDPVANLSLSVTCYPKIYETIMKLASETCDGRLLSVLEGGYSLKFVGKIAAAAIAKMSGTVYTTSDEAPATSERSRKQGQKAIRNAKQAQNVFWDLRP
jgi:acetoin utilization deacetylase AcuC-like enzyme